MKSRLKRIYKNRHRILPLLFRILFLKPFYRLRFFSARHGLFFSDNERSIRKLKNIHNGKRIFVLGNGPSLNSSDLSLLKNEISLAANKIYLMYDETKWRPTYYCVEDDLVMKQNFHDINNVKGSIKIFPADMLAYAPKVEDGLYFNFIQESNYPNLPSVSSDAMVGIYWGSTVVYSMVQIALYMGASEIYIMGVDFSFDVPKSHDYQKKEIVSEGEVNHFHKDYRKPGEKWNLPNLAIQEVSFEALRKYSDLNKTKIYNATRGGKLEKLQRVDTEDLFD
jgi:hypothetical protein